MLLCVSDWHMDIAYGWKTCLIPATKPRVVCQIEEYLK